MVKRVYIEKKRGFDVEADKLYQELKEGMGLPRLKGVRIINRYDVEGIDEETYERAKYAVFSEQAVENACDEELPVDIGKSFFAVSYLPGQYDQRADSAAQCVKMLNPSAEVAVSFAKIIALEGEITDADMAAIKKYCINPVDSHEAQLSKPERLKTENARPADVMIMDGFMNMPETELLSFKERSGFAMSDEDILFVQGHFRDVERRDPTATELKALDAYWSDHCRHTTFLTKLTDIRFDESAGAVKDAYGEYMNMRGEVYGDDEKDVCLMDIACIGAKYLKKQGLLSDLDESDEVNACSIKVKARVDGKEEDWLVMFKNETHNHPSEIEPFGGASTCLGGAIRDPLSGRTYVYQAMRVTGSGDPRKPVAETLAGKLPQRKITNDAAAGYSSYGNQIGLAAGQITEIYDEGYVAKRMELGALVGAAPAENIRRGDPVPGDVIILLGGRRRSERCGGAGGSSKGHTEESIAQAGAEVQKGNPLIERSILRLFRKKEAALLIKKCNDFGAGGVAVAVGELADGIDVDLDLIPRKYDSLDGTELAISESQERMAVLVAKEDKDAFIAYAEEENLEATAIAGVTDTGRFRLFWRGKPIFDLSREFLNTNGVTQNAEVFVRKPGSLETGSGDDVIKNLDRLNCCSQKGLVERFDSTIGAATVLMPLGGKYQLSPASGMAAKLPVLYGETDTATLMAFGFDPAMSKASPFHGAMYAVMESITKIAAMGGDISRVRLSFQEYFEKMKGPESWGKPFAALLGALKVQKELEIPSIGGKDSMSGTFMDMNVPPALISFAVCVADASKVVSTEFKKTDSQIILISAKYDNNGLPDFKNYRKTMRKISLLTGAGKILAAGTVGAGGIFASLVKMAAGNKTGFKIKNMSGEKLTAPDCTAMILEIPEGESAGEMFSGMHFEELGKTTGGNTLEVEGVVTVGIDDAIKRWTAPQDGVFPTRTSDFKDAQDTAYVETITYEGRNSSFPKVRSAKPKVLIPVFPGTNCEEDSRRAFERAGAEVELHIIRNLNQGMLMSSINELARKIKDSRIVMLPGGFSAGDEPGGSAKFITAVFRSERVKEALADLLENRDGLMLGICNGFQALIKLGLLPYGRIMDLDENSMTLTYNKIGRHMSRLVRTRVSSVKSPWFSGFCSGDRPTVADSQGEGRFIASGEQIAGLVESGQIAAQYVDFDGKASMDIDFNPNYSTCAVEAITSPDGRILGKMAHSERMGKNVFKNVPGDYDQKIFESGVKYFNY